MQDRKSETKARTGGNAEANAAEVTVATAQLLENHPSETVSLSREEFASLGGGQVAYVRTMRSEDVHRIFPNAPEIQAGIKIYALLAADGSPILLTDSRDAAVAGAWENELATVAVH